MANKIDQKSIFTTSIQWELGTRILFLFLILAIILNLLPLRSVGLHTRITGFPAILNLAQSGITAERVIIHRRGLYLALGDIAPYTTMILPDDCPLDIAQLYGLGRVRHIKYHSYDPETLFAELDLSDHIVTGFNADKRLGPGPFVIAVENKNPATMVLLTRKGVWYIVDISLLFKGKY